MPPFHTALGTETCADIGQTQRVLYPTSHLGKPLDWVFRAAHARPEQQNSRQAMGLASPAWTGTFD